MIRALMLFMLVSCATASELVTIDKIETLIPDWNEKGELVGFKYPYRRCSRKVIFCVQWELVEIKFPANDTDLQGELRGGDWVLTRREKP